MVKMIASFYSKFSESRERWRKHKAEYEKIFAADPNAMLTSVEFYRWYKRFRRRSVVLVGNSPNLLGQNLGAEIDRFDVVIRLNLTDPSKNSQDLGTRTDVRFVGATMLERHVEAMQHLEHDTFILSSEKNRSFFKDQSADCSFYEKKFPKRAFDVLSEQVPALETENKTSKPPRSGIVALAMLISCTNAKSLTLAGFSMEVEGATTSVRFSDNAVVAYDMAKYTQNHCDPEMEIDVLQALAQLGHIKFLERASYSS